MKKVIKVLLLIALLFLIIIPVFLLPHHKHSSELLTKTVEQGNTRRTDYIDSTGKTTYVADKGYASVLKTYENGHVVLEQYLGEAGETVTLPEGYSIIRRTYENEQNTVISYLGEDNEPIVIAKGYDSIHRTYYPSGDIDTDTYYINDVQVERKNGYWQYKRYYKDGKLTEIRYLDQEGTLSCETTFGYAIIRRNYLEDGREDYYFDASEKPTTASLGQYGVRIEDGRTTYLDADGNPINTNKGYAIVIYEGNRTLYYDKNGLPVTIGHNQYGKEIVDGKTVYLDKNGKQMLRLDNLLNTHQTLVVFTAICLTILATAVKGKIKTFFIIIYVLFIIYMTMWNRETSNSKGTFVLFWSYKQMFSNPSLGQTIINNIWLFVPLGAALYAPKHHCGWMICMAFSVCIEIVQYYTGLGLAEFDDILSNGLGGLIGYGAASNLINWRKKGKELF